MSYTPGDGELRDHVRTQVAVHHTDIDEIAGDAAYMFEVDEDDVQPLVDEAVDAFTRDVATWPAVTDCDRLDAAFAALDAAGIRARQHFACCNTCGHHEMHQDIGFARELQEARIAGYVFYHRQDAETAVTDGVLHLRYATTSGLSDPTREIGERVVAALRAQGFAPVWDGSPMTTIQLKNFAWKRRTWPAQAEAPTTTPGLGEWSARMLATSTSDFAAALGSDYMRALVAADLLDPAFAWARAPMTSILAPMPRATALAALARALGDRDGAADLWREAFACAPYGRNTVLVEVLLDADLADLALREQARERAFDTGRDMCGAATLAWFLVRSGEHSGQSEHAIAQVRRQLDAPAEWPEEGAQLALEAALWVLYTRRGDADAASGMRTRIAAHEYMDRPGTRAVQVAAHELGDAALVAPPAPVLSIAAAEARLAELVVGHAEGLYIDSEVEAARYDLALLRARLGDHEEARGALAELATRYRDDLAFDGGGVRAHVAEIAEGAAPRAYVVDDSYLEETGLRRLARALKRWEAATDADPDSRRQAQYHATKILDAATALAHHGDLAEARRLVALVLDNHASRLRDERATICALLALGELDEAIARADRVSTGCEAVAALVVRLVEAGRLTEARERLTEAWPYAYQRDRVAALAPAVLALADDRQAAATAMLDAWARADAALAPLIP